MAVMAIYPPFFTHILPVLHLTQERHRKGGGRMHAVSGTTVFSVLAEIATGIVVWLWLLMFDNVW